MAEPTCLALTNLDFEYQLAAPPGGRPGPLPAHLGLRWKWILRLLPEARRAHCLDPENPIPPTEPVDRLVVWGVSPQVTHLAEQLGLSHHFPEVDHVRRVNDKRFSHHLERSLGVELPYSQVVESLAQFRTAVETCPHDWVLKHPLGFSGRDRAVGKRHQISDSAWGWARRKLGQNWSLLFEPWVEPRHDFSLHFRIEPEGKVDYLGTCQMVSDPGGIYRGCVVFPDALPNPAALDCGQQVAYQLARQGYWGYVGLDGLAGLLGDRPVLRPLVEINARCSFGRLALALNDWLPSDWGHLWWHPSLADQAGLPPLAPLPHPLTQAGVYALPLSVDPKQTSGTVVVAARTREEIRDLLSLLPASGPTGPGPALERHWPPDARPRQSPDERPDAERRSDT